MILNSIDDSISLTLMKRNISYCLKTTLFLTSVNQFTELIKIIILFLPVQQNIILCSPLFTWQHGFPKETVRCRHPQQKCFYRIQATKDLTIRFSLTSD